ncbi:MAG TPA: tetratricopeptide repeat protein [Opitutaceae bacterium]|nr:tetratricopeptide repeat protein [Opitutaceae bacterium]
MSPLSEPTGPFAAEPRWKVVLTGALIVLAGVAAYHNSFAGPFVFDDPLSIGENLTLRPPWSLAALLSPPADATVGGRPLVNVTLAVNYALGGTEVWGYHAVNLVIHVLAGLTLFGVVRRTIANVGQHRRMPPIRDLAGSGDPALHSDATFLAFIIALLWTLHPLQTEAVTYIVQRTESLMGLFYLLTLYGFIRGAAGDETIGTPPWYRRAWYGFSFGACLLGMACKEVMVSAPVMVLLYDRTFLAESFAEAWQRRWRVHLSLAATWILLGVLVASIGANRGGTTGIGSGASPGAYWLTQFPAVMEYLWLSLWPYPLVFDYGAEWVRHAVDVVPAALIVILLAAGTLVALKRRPILGFLGAWFFAILGPSSLVPGPRQTMAEHRMYLALAAVLTLVVVGGWAWAGRRTLVAWLALALGFGGLTVARNEVYRTELSLWRDTVARRPGNRWAQCNVGMALYEQGRVAEALPHFERGLKLGPDDPAAHNDLGLALAKLGRLPEAVAQYEAALQFEPAFAEAHNNLGLALSELNRPVEGLEHLRTALRLRPGLATVHFNLGNTLAQLGRLDEAVAHFLEAIRSNPNDAAACTNLGNVLARAGRIAEAIRWYETAARLDPGDALAQYNLAMMLAQVGRTSEAIEHFQEVLRLRPDDTEARENLMRLQAVLRPGGTR